MKAIGFRLFLFAALGAAACAAPAIEDAEQASSSSNNLWKQRDIDVCFADGIDKTP